MIYSRTFCAHRCQLVIADTIERGDPLNIPTKKPWIFAMESYINLVGG